MIEGHGLRSTRASFFAGACVGFWLAFPPISSALTPPNEASAERAESVCEITAKEFSLKGKALEKSVQACMATDSPNLAYWETCRTKGRHQSLRHRKLRDFVAFCMSRRQ